MGVSVLYLPAYSPDLNPIEKMFAKLKALLRKAEARTIDELWDEIGRIVTAINLGECRNYIASSGYACEWAGNTLIVTAASD